MSKWWKQFPTLPEIGSVAYCMVFGHEWSADEDECQNCGAHREALGGG